jgi:threonine/homoserine/homoserine lactone efflux protein
MDTELLDCLSRGTLLGLAAGFSPGPLSFLVIAETLAHGLRAGIKVALAPALTDVPIILLTWLVLDHLRHYQAVSAAIPLIGGLFLCRVGFTSLTYREAALNTGDLRPHSLAKGVAANLLNPNPYIFWASVGTPAILNALSISAIHAAAFAGSFFAVIVSSKIALAGTVDRLRTFLSSPLYRWIMRILGLLLMGYAAALFRDGLATIGLIG